MNIRMSLMKIGLLLRHFNKALMTFVHDEHSNVEHNELLGDVRHAFHPLCVMPTMTSNSDLTPA